MKATCPTCGADWIHGDTHQGEGFCKECVDEIRRVFCSYHVSKPKALIRTVEDRAQMPCPLPPEPEWAADWEEREGT